LASSDVMPRKVCVCASGSTIVSGGNFSGRILPVDDGIATRCAHLHIPDRRNEVDALIAATALVHGLTVVTRNVRDFEGTGVIVIDPWQG
jgi:predicted nucleic acid-binding protein